MSAGPVLWTEMMPMTTLPDRDYFNELLPPRMPDRSAFDHCPKWSLLARISDSTPSDANSVNPTNSHRRFLSRITRDGALSQAKAIQAQSR